MAAQVCGAAESCSRPRSWLSVFITCCVSSMCQTAGGDRTDMKRPISPGGPGLQGETWLREPGWVRAGLRGSRLRSQARREERRVSHLCVECRSSGQGVSCGKGNSGNAKGRLEPPVPGQRSSGDDPGRGAWGLESLTRQVPQRHGGPSRPLLPREQLVRGHLPVPVPREPFCGASEY